MTQDARPQAGPRILAFAYSAHPEEGSEAGAGWVFARLLAGVGDTWVLTRTVPPSMPDDRWPGPGQFDAWLSDVPEASTLHFVHVPIPWWDAFWWTRRDRRPGFTRLQRVEYVAWLWLARRKARELMRERRYDLGWHVTWANVWMGSTLPLTRLPFVYGPVGGGADPPWVLVADLGFRQFLIEAGRALSRAGFRYLNPLFLLAVKRAALILSQNPETRDWLPSSARDRTVVFPNAMVTEVAPRLRRPTGPPFTALVVGRLVPSKGGTLAIRALAHLPGWRLAFVGSGHEEPVLRALAQSLGVADRVEFRGQLPRSEVLAIMRDEADVLLFPSLRDQAPFAVAEAVANGLPVVCLDRGGAPVLGGIGVKATTPDRTVRALAEGVLSAVAGEPRAGAHGINPVMSARRAELVAVLRERGLLPPSD